jgi:hypothetical protein
MRGLNQSRLDAESGGIDRPKYTFRMDDSDIVLTSVSTASSEAPHNMSAQRPVSLPAARALEAIEQYLQHFSVEHKS